jgi:hypothetical protein
MKAKLIKRDDSYYYLQNDEGIIAFYSDKRQEHSHYKLSLKNCQAIELGYDLEELAEKHIKEWEYERLLGGSFATLAHDNFVMGFQKALELMGDKKFTEEDLRIAFNCNHMTQSQKEEHWKTFPQSLQQTEWDVEIDMECIVSTSFQMLDFSKIHK